jgi:transketolase
MHNYKEMAKQARLKVLEMIHNAQTSHIGSNLSVIDILTVLYENAYITKEDWENRDRVILSKGWAAASLYYFLERKGLINRADLDSYCRGDSKFIGLAEPIVSGIEFAGGSMGHGLPAGVGMALAAKRSGKDYKVYVVMSDGELNCGTTWESILIAAHHQLNNLVIIIDKNGWQAMGKTDEVLDTYTPGGLQTRSFTVDGHNHEQLEKFIFDKYENGIDTRSGPLVLDCLTVKGKGVSFMENKLEWHYRNVDEESYRKAVHELA